MTRRTSPNVYRGQKGAALIIGLIILVVLTLIGVQAMRTSIVQERMAGNMRERNVAFQAAEAALRVGEATGPFTPGNAALTDPAGWDGTGSTGSIPSFDAGVAGPPVYQVGPPQYVRLGLTLPPEFRYIYPVTARGLGGQPTSVVVVQSAFEPMN
jgi:type IV pilus assembly protein PilX